MKNYFKNKKAGFVLMQFIFKPFQQYSYFLAASFFIIFLTVFSRAQDEAKDPVEIFNQGQTAHEKGDFQTALSFYDEALKIMPEFPEAEFQRGNAFVSLGKTTEAEKAFRRALELRADWTLPMTSLGVLLVQQNKFPEAEKLLTDAVGSDAQNFSAYTALTELRLKTKAAPETLKQLLTRIELLTAKANPTAAIWASRAALENALGDKTAAKTSLNRALSIDPKDKSALLELGEIAVSEGDTKTASEIAKTLSQIAPDSNYSKILQARLNAANGNAAEALKILDSIENKTTDILLLREKIAASNSVNSVDLEKQIESDPKNAALLGRLCNLLRTENPQKALDYCRRASEAEPNNVNHATGFGAALVQAKQYENAAFVLSRILQIAPDNFTAHANLATALFQLKKFAQAKKEYVWLTEKQPDLAIAYYFLAIAHDNLTEYLDAMANYQQFLKLADAEKNKLEIEKVNLRLPALQKLIKTKKGKKQ